MQASDPRFSYPIPGMSLTATPKNAPWERPPEIVEPEEALQMHIDRLNDPDKLTSVVQVVEAGVDIATLTEGILRGAVMGGQHTVDVSLLIGPAVHEFIRVHMEVLGIEYDNGFGDGKKKSEDFKEMGRANERQRLSDTEGSDAPPMRPSPEELETVATEEIIPDAETHGAGLMQRRV